MPGAQPSTFPPVPHNKASAGALDKQGKYGLKENKANNSVPQKVKKVPNKSNLHNQMDSFYPDGIPKSAIERSNKLVYDWERTKNKERNDRDPVAKPLAVPLDDEFLSVLPSDSVKVAWRHLTSDKKRPSLEDFNETPEPVRERAVPPIEEAKFTETANALLNPSEMQPTPKISPSQLTGDFPEEPELHYITHRNDLPPLRIPNGLLPEKMAVWPLAALYFKSSRASYRLPFCTPKPVPIRRTVTGDYKRHIGRTGKATCNSSRTRRRDPLGQPGRVCWDCGLLYRRNCLPGAPSGPCRRPSTPVRHTCYSSANCCDRNITVAEESASLIRLKPVINACQRHLAHVASNQPSNRKTSLVYKINI